VSILQEHGYPCEHIARQFQPSWFSRVDLVIALDTGHLRALRRLAPTEEDARKVRLLRSYDPAAGDDLEVPDPYYGHRDGFEECLEMVEAASTGLLAAVREQLEGRAA
jgi:protein-tyrosine phosphatase